MRQLVLPFSSGFFARKAIAARAGPRVLNQLLVDLEARVMMVVVCYYRNLRLRRIGYCETKVGKVTRCPASQRVGHAGPCRQSQAAVGSGQQRAEASCRSGQ